MPDWGVQQAQLLHPEAFASQRAVSEQQADVVPAATIRAIVAAMVPPTVRAQLDATWPSLMKAIAPVVKDFVGTQLAPLQSEFEMVRDPVPVTKNEMSPVISVDLWEAFGAINAACFNDRVPPMPVTVHHARAAWGTYHKSPEHISIHSILAQHAPKSVVFATLAHEMCHSLTADEADRHGPMWCAEMEAIGIDPLTREVLPNGPFSNWLAARGIDTGGNDSSSSDCGTLRAEIATLKHELAAVKASVPTYRGVWDANDCYSANDLCTWDGSLWYALEDTARKPGSGANSGWRLAVKRGAVRK